MKHLSQDIIAKATSLRNSMELTKSHAEGLREEASHQDGIVLEIEKKIREMTGGCDCFSLRIMCPGHPERKK